MNDDIETLKLLLDHPYAVDVNLPCNKLTMAPLLHQAILRRNPEAVQAVLGVGAEHVQQGKKMLGYIDTISEWHVHANGQPVMRGQNNDTPQYVTPIDLAIELLL